MLCASFGSPGSTVPSLCIGVCDVYDHLNYYRTCSSLLSWYSLIVCQRKDFCYEKLRVFAMRCHVCYFFDISQRSIFIPLKWSSKILTIRCV